MVKKPTSNPYKTLCEQMCVSMLQLTDMYNSLACEDVNDVIEDMYEEEAYKELVDAMEMRRQIAQTMRDCGRIFETALKELNPNFSTSSVEEELLKKAQKMYVTERYTSSNHAKIVEAAMTEVRCMNFPPNLEVVK